HRPSRMVVALGNFDGVHLGHQALLRLGQRLAVEHDACLCALFLEPHPLAVLRPAELPPLLTEPARRQALLLAEGASRVVILPFTPAMALLSPADFVRRYLVEELCAVAVVVGEGFRFGHARQGDVATLRQLGAACGFDVHAHVAVQADGAVVSSTRVRQHLLAGDVAAAARLLGRVHECEAAVVRGAARGRTLGFATANLAPVATLLPADGVYAVVARSVQHDSAGPVYGGMANVGPRPTLDRVRGVEVHLFDFAGDLYDKMLRVGFVARLRTQQKFPDLAALQAQLHVDQQQAGHALTLASTGLWRQL
ncbi:MAG: riboflavin biosynthesis protein RibF, partial [Polyangiales bacterium]